MDWNILTIIGTNIIVMWYLMYPIRKSLGEIREEIKEIRKDVKQNGERIARIEGIIWADIDKAQVKNERNKV